MLALVDILLYIICPAFVIIAALLLVMAYCDLRKKCPKCKCKLNNESGFYQLADLKPLTSQSEYDLLTEKSQFIHGTRCDRAVGVIYLKCSKCGWHSVRYDSC
jgi:hypothetical protein